MNAPASQPPATDAQVMPCMEVWGGNQAVDCGVVMSGIDAWLYSRPHQGDAAGGDVHYVSSCATGRITRVLVADVSGHGTAVAEMGTKLRGLMRRHVNHLDQTKFIASLNGEFGSMAASGCFATSVVATFFAPTNQLAVVNAGHPPPLVYRRKAVSWTFLEGAADSQDSQGQQANVPLGILEEGRYEQENLRLQVGDLVLLYTDSLTESRGADGRLLGTEGLLETVRRLDATHPETLVSSLLDAIGAIAPDNLSADDVTVLLLRPNGMMPRVPLRELVKLPFRMARGLIQSLRGAGPMSWPELTIASIGGAFFSRLNRYWRP